MIGKPARLRPKKVKAIWQEESRVSCPALKIRRQDIGRRLADVRASTSRHHKVDNVQKRCTTPPLLPVGRPDVVDNKQQKRKKRRVSDDVYDK